MNFKNQFFLNKKDAELSGNFRKLFIKTILLILFFLGLLFLINHNRNKEDNAYLLLTQTKEVILQSEKTISLVKDYETASRGFVISNNEAFLAPVLNTKDSIRLSVEKLHNLTKANIKQKKRIDSLEKYIHKRILISDSIVKLRREISFTAAYELVSSGIGKRYMDTVRSLESHLQQDEKDLLIQRQQDSVKARLIFLATVTASLVLFFVFLIILFWQAGSNLSRYNDRQEEVNKILSQLAASLLKAQQIAHIGSWERIINTDEEKWSDEQYRILGYEPDSENAKPLNFIKSVHPGDQALVFEMIKNTIEKKCPFTFIFRIVQPGGQIRHIKAMGEVYKIIDEGLGIGGTMQDITEEYKIQQEKEKLTALLEKSNEIAKIGWWDADLTNKSIKWSNVIKKILEIPPAFEPSYDSFFNFIVDHESREIFHKAYTNALANGISFDLKLPFITSKGNNILVRITGEKSLNEDGEYNQILGIFQYLNTL